MTHPTLDRDVAEKIFRIVGECDTKSIWFLIQDDVGWKEQLETKPHISHNTDILSHPGTIKGLQGFSAPDFSETIRILPEIGEKKMWHLDIPHGGKDHSIGDVYSRLCVIYGFAPTPSEGMKLVSDYLRKIL